METAGPVERSGITGESIISMSHVEAKVVRDTNTRDVLYHFSFSFAFFFFLLYGTAVRVCSSERHKSKIQCCLRSPLVDTACLFDVALL